jgi:hypothetical protein
LRAYVTSIRQMNEPLSWSELMFLPDSTELTLTSESLLCYMHYKNPIPLTYQPKLTILTLMLTFLVTLLSIRWVVVLLPCHSLLTLTQKTLTPPNPPLSTTLLPLPIPCRPHTPLTTQGYSGLHSTPRILPPLLPLTPLR